MRAETIARYGLGRFLLLIACLFVAPAVSAQAGSPSASPLSVETIFSADARARGIGSIRWSRDGESYMLLERSAQGQSGSDIVRYSVRSGQRDVLVASRELTPVGAAGPLLPEDFQWSADGSLLLLKTGSRPFRRTRPLGDFWLFDMAKRGLRRVGGDAPPSNLMYADLSPDGRSIAYVRDGNLYVEPTSGASSPRRLTADGSEAVVNGIGDWAYEEEFRLGKAFAWSPDSQRIAYWRFDMSAVGAFRMIRNTARPYPETASIRYPKVGTANSRVQVGAVEIANGRTTWLRLPGDPAETYVPQMSWAGGSDALLLQVSNRLQNRYSVMTANALTGEASPLFVEEDAAWVERNPDPVWVRGGKDFLWMSERDGWRHLYLRSRDGKRSALLTPGRFDVMSPVSVDEASGWIYFTASPDNATQRYLYRAALTGKAKVERVTPAGEAGWHQYDIAPGARWAIKGSSTVDTPPVVSLVDLATGKSLRVLEGNGAAARMVAANPLPATEFRRLDIGGGVQLDAWVMRPAGFDPARKYPVLFQVYGEPAGTTVTDQWGGARGWWHRMLAQQGYVVASIDPRGTPQPRGRAWRKSIYRQVGILASADLAAGVRRLLAEMPFMDKGRVGIWGWSGGGAMTMNAMFRYPELFGTGIAVAGPSDQLLYDSIYQERYMGLPRDNAEGYRDGSPINFVDGLRGNLLLIHGTGDDNVHYQHMEQLIERLIGANKQFTMMAYPDRAHFINEMTVGNATSIHLFNLMTRYLDENLKRDAKGRAASAASPPRTSR